MNNLQSSTVKSPLPPFIKGGKTWQHGIKRPPLLKGDRGGFLHATGLFMHRG